MCLLVNKVPDRLPTALAGCCQCASQSWAQSQNPWTRATACWCPLSSCTWSLRGHRGRRLGSLCVVSNTVEMIRGRCNLWIAHRSNARFNRRAVTQNLITVGRRDRKILLLSCCYVLYKWHIVHVCPSEVGGSFLSGSSWGFSFPLFRVF